MGGNNSKLNPGGSGEMPAKIRPLLRQRMEEFRKRRGGISALSKKQLLKDDGTNNSHLSSENEIETQTTQPAARVLEKLSISKVVPLPPSEYGGTKAEIKSYFSRPLQGEEANVKHNDDDEDSSSSSSEDEDETGRLIGPSRSPSFRIYCNDEAEKEKQIIEIETQASEKDKETTPILYQKYPSIESNESAASASVNSRNSKEVFKMEKTSKRKGHKIKKLGAMKKNLLNVKNIQMNRMMGCAGNDRRRLLIDN